MYTITTNVLRKVFEISAIGTLVYQNYSKNINNYLVTVFFLLFLILNQSSNLKLILLHKYEDFDLLFAYKLNGIWRLMNV